MTTENLLPSDRAYCRRVLPQVSRTFALNIRLLSGRFGEAVRVGYLLCRSADAIEDSWPGSPPEIRARFARLIAALQGDAQAAEHLAAAAAEVAGTRSDLELVAQLPRVLRVLAAQPEANRAAIVECVRTMAEGMSHYATRAASRPEGACYLDTESELHHYCWIVAGCVGVMLERMFQAGAHTEAASAAARLELASVVGEALQLTNIVLDWPSDLRRGRCYLPATWLEAEGLKPRDLVDRERPETSLIARRLEALARAALERVPDYLALVPARHVRYRLFCAWPALWAAASLRHAARDPQFPWGPRRPRLPRAELWGTALRSLVSGHSDASLRHLFATYRGPTRGAA